MGLRKQLKKCTPIVIRGATYEARSRYKETIKSARTDVVKRYTVVATPDDWEYECKEIENPEGRYVLYEAYASMLGRLQKLQKDISSMKKASGYLIELAEDLRLLDES